MSLLSPRAPKNTTVLISILLVLLGLFGTSIDPTIAQNSDYIILGGFVLLLLGIYVKGL